MRVLFSLLLFLIPLAFWSCGDSNDTVTGDAPDLIPVKIDLVNGFYGKGVVLDIDTVQFFSVNEMGPSPISGPEASFVTFLAKGSHLLSIRLSESGVIAFQDSARLEIDSAEKYYVALDITRDENGRYGKLRTVLVTVYLL